MTAIDHPAAARFPVAAVAAAGASLGVVAGLVELTLGPSMRSWVGDKQDTTRLGLVTILLAGLALMAAAALRRRTLLAPERFAAAVAILVPGSVGLTTVGRLWYLPGALLVVSGIAALAGLRGEVRAVTGALARNWTAVLTAVLSVFYVLLGATALGVAGLLGMVGGVAVLAVLRFRRRLPVAAGFALIAVAVAPFALLTWWSIATPLIAVLLLAHTVPAMRPGPRPGRSGATAPGGARP